LTKIARKTFIPYLPVTTSFAGQLKLFGIAPAMLGEHRRNHDGLQGEGKDSLSSATMDGEAG
jgi:hypothetical protein